MTVVVTHTTPADGTFSAAGAAAWDADHALSGLGTMAEQNKTSVDIEGGTIDNTTIGATTPSTGVFTTLIATGQTSLGGAAGSESFRAIPVASAVNFLEARGGVAGNTNFPRLLTEGADANIWMTLVAKGATGIRNFVNGAEQFRVASTASAVNYVQVTGAATTGSPTISAQGSDTNINLTLNAKGSASVLFQTAGQNAFQVTGSGIVVNRLIATGTATGVAPSVSCVGSDTNISQVFQSKGTGAIDLAAGSSGVNISNGGTVTAITRTAFGSGYTSIPTVAISAPTTAGGVQATATASMSNSSVVTITNGGTGYSVNNVLTVQGGTSSVAIQITVSAVSGGVITAAAITTVGLYTVLPTNPVSVTGGTGTGATFTLGTWYVGSTFTITNAGSGYVEQPTVTFSGGGGSGAAAYATVGGDTAVKTLGTNLTFSTPAGPVLALADSTTGGAYIQLSNSSTGNTFARATGSATNIGFYWLSKGTGGHAFTTNNNSGTVQLNVAHTASAVNYVQVTGAATGNNPVLSSQGSDANIGMRFYSKGAVGLSFWTSGGSSRQFQVEHTSGSVVNYAFATGSVAGAGPIFSVAGSDTNIDLNLTPKGTGNVRFGTYTGTALSIAGYIEIKDSGGTVRKLAVVA